MKGKKSILSALLAVTIAGSMGFGMVTQTACGNLNNDGTQNEQPQTTYYNLTLNLNGGKLAEGQNITKFEANKRLILPTPQRSGYKFEGWYDNEQLTGSAYAQIDKADANSDKEFWAKWSVVEGDEPDVKPETYTVTLYFNGGRIVSGSDITSYTYGVGATLPILEKDGHTFEGWYESSTFAGSSVTEITKTDSGAKTYYAKWAPITSSTINVKAVGGYEEGAYIEFDRLNDTVASDYTVLYKPSANGASDYKAIDSQLIREMKDGSIRADIVGLSVGNYDIRVKVNNYVEDRSNIQVTAYDRSGYAHFKYENGVGAYNDDGTVKKDAVILYVTEETKNTVSLKIGNSTYNGIANILAKSGNLNGKPLIVRVLGTVSAATWNKIDYKEMYNLKTGEKITDTNKIVDKNNKAIPTGKSLSQAEILSAGYNTLDTSVYSELEGLSSTMKWSSKDNEWDSYWNMCDVGYASNITVEGVGTDARLFQWGFTWKVCSSIEVRNLTFEDYTEDACSFEGGTDSTTMDGFDSNRIWVHNNAFLEGKNYWDVCPEQDKHEGDGATDFKKNAYITISYNHYFENHKTGLVGGGDSQTTACLTYHHNWYEKCSSRLPLARQANIHIYNNYYDGTTGENMSLRAGAYALVENCYFKNVKAPIVTKIGDSKKGIVKVVNCTFDGCSISSDYKDKTVFVVSRTTIVDNDNVYAKDFDTNPNVFYYDSVAQKSSVATLTGRNNVPDNVKERSGVHKG